MDDFYILRCILMKYLLHLAMYCNERSFSYLAMYFLMDDFYILRCILMKDLATYCNERSFLYPKMYF